MIGLSSFIFISICIYLLVFLIMPKMKLPNIAEILLMSYIGGSYLNIADKGNVVNWLDIELTETIRWISMVIVVIYIISAWFVFIKKRKNGKTATK